jgi:hypothetical protein
MFAALDDAIEIILGQAPATLTLSGATIDFKTPPKNFNPSVDTINLFLLEVKENRVLHDPEPIYEFNAGVYTRKTPPMRVDVTYVVTAWASSTAIDPIETEHNLLAQALGWLNHYPVIPAALVPNQPYPVLMFTALPDERLNIGEFWSALGIQPRAAFTITATVALDYSLAIPFGPPVVTKEIQIKRKMPPGIAEPLLDITFEIAGTIRSVATGNAIPDVHVTLLPFGWITDTDVNGHFYFTGLVAGNYTLKATKANFNAPNKPIVVPPAPGAGANSYDIKMTP